MLFVIFDFYHQKLIVMDDTSIILLCLLALVIGCAISYYVIRIATDTPKRFKYEIIQTKLLMKMAEKAGVSKEEIDEIIDSELAEKPKSSWF